VPARLQPLDPFLERLDDRLDPLADEADRWFGPVVLVGAAGSEDERPELMDGLFEVAAGEALVAEDELSVERLPVQKRQPGLALGSVGRDEVEVDDRPVRPTERDQPHPTQPSRRRKQRAGSAIQCNHEGVEVGAHVGLLVDGAFATPTFDHPCSWSLHASHRPNREFPVKHLAGFGPIHADNQRAGAGEDKHELLRLVGRVDVAVDETGWHVEEASCGDLDVLVAVGAELEPGSSSDQIALNLTITVVMPPRCHSRVGASPDEYRSIGLECDLTDDSDIARSFGETIR
jgi:hypothetical protein